jgi:multiple sugar transport system permease protein
MATRSADVSISELTTSPAGPATRARRAGRPRSLTGRWNRISYAFVSGYVLLALAFGVFPTIYALRMSFTSSEGTFSGVDNFQRVIDDFRFWPAVQHVAAFVVIWLVGLLIFVTILALLVHQIGTRWLSSGVRFVYYIPGALAGASAVVLWLFVLDPTVSPVSGVLHAFGFDSFVETISPGNLPVIFAVMAFWTGAGGWIVVMYGALNSIPTEVLEAARIDGAGVVRTALHIQLPMLRKWISYMASRRCCHKPATVSCRTTTRSTSSPTCTRSSSRT